MVKSVDCVFVDFMDFVYILYISGIIGLLKVYRDMIIIIFFLYWWEIFISDGIIWIFVYRIMNNMEFLVDVNYCW